MQIFQRQILEIPDYPCSSELRLGKGGCMVCPAMITAREECVGHAALCPTYQPTNLLYLQKIHCVLKQVLLQLEGRHDQLLPDLDSFIASRISLVVALVSIPGTSKGDFGLFLKVMEKASPPLRFITTSSVRAMLSTSESRCLASEYVYTFIMLLQEHDTHFPGNSLHAPVQGN